MMLPRALLGTKLGRVGGLKFGCEARASLGGSVWRPGSMLPRGITRTSERPACDGLALSASSRTTPRPSRGDGSPGNSTTWRAARRTKIKIRVGFLSLRDLRESKKKWRARETYSGASRTAHLTQRRICAGGVLARNVAQRTQTRYLLRQSRSMSSESRMIRRMSGNASRSLRLSRAAERGARAG